ncbi:hypothetical protein HYC85_001609 [Camellia sinensis]|uniref:Mono-/di-acylglycerol lipase N-terminal domain-containing protein n=1 Tax=Camellia sinensis TaxID=4442 RepID=A0A7J7I5V1_CAMSI|nr:hypothetical protein HYC85_001609 [Camellia sinensis]
MCLQLLGCLQWACKRCTYIGSYDSATWPPATAEEFEAVPRICRLILAVYEDDLRHPQFPPSGGYRLNPDCVIKQPHLPADSRQRPSLHHLPRPPPPRDCSRHPWPQFDQRERLQAPS